MIPSASPSRAIRIWRRRRIERILVNKHRRRGGDDRTPNHDGFVNERSRLLNVHWRRRYTILVRVNFGPVARSCAIWRHIQIGGHCWRSKR
jgi:hypothetical protein